MSTTNLDEHDLRTDITGSDNINEDVLQQLQQIDRYPAVFSNSIGSGSSSSKTFHEWMIHEKAEQDGTIAGIDGQDIDQDDSVLSYRVGNHVQIKFKGVKVSYGAQASDTIGRSNELAFQLNQRQMDLDQEIEVTLLRNQASVDPTDAAAGTLGSFPSWFGEFNSTSGWAANLSQRGATGADGGYNPSTKVVDAATAGTARGLTETMIRNGAQAVYEEGGMPAKLMSNPTMIRGISEYMFTSSARIATEVANTSGDSGTGALRGKGSVNVFITDFDVVLDMMANRDQPDYSNGSHGSAGVVDVFIYDPSMVAKSTFKGRSAQRQGIKGLYDPWQISEYCTLEVMNPKSHAIISDITAATAVTQS